MKLTFLGGANEVGASCTLLEVAGKRILIDAGIRMGAREADRLPNLSQIQDGGPLDAILLTHAHTDHIGALPLVHIAYPRIPIFTTAPTKRLTQILLSDALRIMESRWQQEQELPLYPEHTVTAMLAQFQIVEPGQRPSPASARPYWNERSRSSAAVSRKTAGSNSLSSLHKWPSGTKSCALIWRAKSAGPCVSPANPIRI